MDTTALVPLLAFRQAVYAALDRQRDALFEVLDALTSTGPVPALAHLSQAPAFRRGWGSLYAALARGTLDVPAVRRLLAAWPLADGAAIYGVDLSAWPRPEARTSAARGYCHVPGRRGRGAAAVPGWRYQWIRQLSLARSSWTAPLEVERVAPTANAHQVAATQIGRLVRQGRAGVWVFDAGDDAVQLALALQEELGQPLDAPTSRVAVLVRLRADRCFYADPVPLPPGAPGRPRVHGRRFACPDPSTWPAPSAEHITRDPVYGAVRVRAWSGLHGIPRDHAGRGRRDQRGHVPIVRGSVLLVEVSRLPHTARSGRTPRPLWLWWQGPGTPDLAQLWRAYVQRFDLEHTSRFAKQTLNWVTPRLRTPEQADRWTWLVVLAYTQLRLARGVAADQRLPWQRPQPAGQLTPGRVRQGFTAVRLALGSPARAPQPCGRSPGRPRGRTSPPALRHPVIKKTA